MNMSEMPTPEMPAHDNGALPLTDGSMYRNQLEPTGLIRHFLARPPEGFTAFELDGTPAFFAPFDLLTTLDTDLRKRLSRLPGSGPLMRLLRFRTCFFGSTVSEYAPWSGNSTSDGALAKMLNAWKRESLLMIIKDIPEQSPLLSAAENEYADSFVSICKKHGFIVLEGQALAYVPIDFASDDEYLARLSAGRRKNIRRKLRVRDKLHVEIVPTGHAQFQNTAVLDELYALYLEVYAQSEIHFDRLTPEFFRAVLQDASLHGRLFLYYNAEQLIGYNLCFIHANMLVDKYVGFRYPAARDFNLYFISWMENLAYARTHGLTHYVAGWTDPEVKSFLGARFTFTRHAVFVRNPVLRAVLRRLSRHFESDRAWFDTQADEPI
jgi:predicted N-acyltransferase